MKAGHSNLLILSESIITVDLEINMEEDLNPRKPKSVSECICIIHNYYAQSISL